MTDAPSHPPRPPMLRCELFPEAGKQDCLPYRAFSRSRMIYAAVAVSALALAGCSTLARVTANLPIPLSAIRSPITIKNFWWPHNGPIEVADRGALNCAAQVVVNDRNKTSSSPASYSSTLLRDVAWNQSHSNAFCKNPIFAQTNALDTFDTFQDLCGSDSQASYSSTLLFVAVSGGGARATALASHALALLEQKYNAYNQAGQANPDFVPFIDRIAVFSTVSGGSLYSYQVAILKTLLDDAQKTVDRKDAGGLREVQQQLTEARKIQWARENFFTIVDIFPEMPTKGIEGSWPAILYNLIPNAEDVGLWTAFTYLHSVNLILPLITDINYLDLLSQGLTAQTLARNIELAWDLPEITKNAVTTPVAVRTFWQALRFNPTTIKLSDLTPKPRFFFNATILETGLPLVFTQRFTHLPIESLHGYTARLDLTMQKKSAAAARTLTGC